MKALYYDCFAGLSGDMNLGAMIDLGVDFDALRLELSKLGLDSEFELIRSRADKHGIFGTKIDVIDKNNHDHDHTQGQKHDHDHDHKQEDHDHKHENRDHDRHDHHKQVHDHDHKHDHDHDHKHDHDHEHKHEHDHDHNHEKLRDFKDIKGIITSSTLSERVKADSIKVFQIIAEAEAKIHGKTVDEVHFHEVGAIDSIVDVVGAAICLDLLGVTTILASTVEVGSGFVRCAHGLMPIPAPATAEILRGVPIKSDVKKFEQTTPTGAALLKAFVTRFTDEKAFKILRIGYGLGLRNLDIPNLVRVMLVELSDEAHVIDHATKDTPQWILETNIDDMSSELLVYAEEKLFESGALDVYKTSIIMKKGRPAIKLTILAKQKDIKALQTIIFNETTSIGMRMYPVEKVKIERKYIVVETSYGPISLKKAYFEGSCVNVKPEYEQIKKFAVESGLPVKHVYQDVLCQINGHT